MAKFEIGILVRIVDGPNFTEAREFIGHVGKITKYCGKDINDNLVWDVSGAESADGDGWAEYVLEPIDPPKEELGSWDTIENDTGWNPTKQRETI